MRRTPIVITSAVAGLTTVLAFHSSSPVPGISGISIAVPAAGAPAASGGSGPTAQPGSAGSVNGTGSPAAAAQPGSPGSASGTGSPTPAVQPGSAAGAGAPGSAGSAGGTGSPAAAVQPGSAASASAPGSLASPSSAAPAGGAQTATGPAVTYNWGVISVKVTVSGSTITNVATASLDYRGNPHSQNLDQQAIPLLEQQALQAQSANIQGVSGASYTSAGFQKSLQGALQSLGFK